MNKFTFLLSSVKLEKIRSPRDLDGMSYEALEELAGEIRNELVTIVSENGGHLASNLGAVELTLALHRVFHMPEDRIIVETDCPYLAPIPHRGRRNEPAYVGLVLQKLAEVRGWTPEEADRRTTDAFFALFDRIPRPAE